ncbi:hypothetical protein [Pseudomonas violetae]|uniref:Uncharacterized protein n=1 Tax=Pseudomonas violetae TaxID=2915813 RepID=A0ABT0F273_9PSED|nr:hypothetical protein [Pseudomonas violetae]MCK1792055.1 hypothetical protein [Pseudomonas violetae]
MKIYYGFFMSMLLISSFIVGQASGASKELTQKGEGEEASQSFLWSGYYLKKSELCTSPGSGDDCSEQFHDCLKVEPGRQGYLVKLYSTQADQNVCSFTFQMDAADGVLVYKTQFGRVLLQRNGESLEISSEGIDPTALGLGVCGVHADIDGLKFPLVSKSNAISACPAHN